MIASLLDMTPQIDTLLSRGMSFDAKHTSPQLIATKMTLAQPSDKLLQDNVMARLMLPTSPVADIPGMTPKMSTPY